MEPFLAIGKLLQKRGHRVIAAFPEQFRYLAEKCNIEFASLGSKFIELLDSELGKNALGGSGAGFKKFTAYMKLAHKQNEINRELVNCQYEIVQKEKPDRIIYNGKSVYPIIWEVKNMKKSILISPVPYLHFVKNHAHVAFNRNFGDFFNKLTYCLADFGLLVTLIITIKWLKISEVTKKQISDSIHNRKVIYTISPSLFPRPSTWNENLKILGYYQLEEVGNWSPDEKLISFLDRHKDRPILLVTFGSMTNPEPKKKAEIIIEVVQKLDFPTIINTAAGGLLEPEEYNQDLIHFVPYIPYSWIFPKVYAVIHHGGSGTTHLSLKYGCTTMIIPHIIDQFAWDKMIFNLKLGPRGVRIDKLSNGSLETKILDLMKNKSYKQKAEQIAGQMKKENFEQEICRTIIGL